MKILDKLNKEIITIMIIAGLLFTAVFIALAFLIELNGKTQEELGEKIVGKRTDNTHQVLDESW